MKDQLQGLGQKLWNDFRAFSAGQKAVTIAAALALIIGGYLFTTWKSAPTYAPLYTNLAASDASAIVDKLNSEKVPYKLAAGGTEIMVPQSQVYDTRLKMSSAGLPGSSQTGYSLLDKEGVTTSEFKQQVDYQRAIEGELGKTIQAINGVQAASVHLAIPQQDVFNDGSQKATAAVMLTTSAGTHLTSQQVQSIVYLVSSSVPNMDSDGVTVTDADGQVLAAPGDGLSGAAFNDTQTQATQDYDNRVAASLQNMIDRALGTGHAVVTVNSVLNFDKTSTTSQTYTSNPSNPPLSSQEQTEKYTGTGNGSGGTLGAGTPAVGSTATNGAGSYQKTNKVVNNALGTVTQTIQSAPGAVKKQSIAVLLDGSVKNVNIASIESLVKSGVGFDATRGDTLAVQAMPFDNSAAQQAAQAAEAAKRAAADKAAHDQLMSLVKQGALGALVVALVIGTWLAGRKRKKRDDGDAQFFDDLLPLPDAPVAPAPAPEHNALTNEIHEAAARRHALVTLADEQPDDVARVLSGWLNSREN
ncbi:flagellar M-ring protein FliF [Jatrophihabitans cynanchi]|jgi:flagellar M-ring protein FliF|uniref:Flagellar M-ring protein n=1 Tax=Jatrophihabitans cynanchi TaxID=2944128 RepID=A0ABY7JSX7_9ACTN|nr:flagellar basal-body MS-ring/collar protein FliF [Jatrophihabitans sp. SB3-54]WAX55444.1 flagellar M-ring protein FliF [Jatrophihabitans sp. SB3-54]